MFGFLIGVSFLSLATFSLSADNECVSPHVCGVVPLLTAKSEGCESTFSDIPKLSLAGNHKESSTDFRAALKAYKEHKDDYDKIMKAANSESEVLDRLYMDLLNAQSDEQAILKLEQMEDLLRKYDNAVDFANGGKLTGLMNLLNDASDEKAISILSCFAASLQANPPVQIAMHRTGLLNHIAQKWHQELNSPAPSSGIIAQCLLVTSVLMRYFPHAQKTFFGPQEWGIPVGFMLLNRTLAMNSTNGKLNTRLFSLLGDLLEEQNSAKTFRDIDKQNQYKQINLSESLPNYGFCHAAVQSLFNPSVTENASYRQRLMQAVQRIANVCSPSQLFPVDAELQREEVAILLAQWENEFNEKAADEAADNTDSDVRYFDEVLRLLSDLQHSLLYQSK